MAQKPSIPKGTRDFSPAEITKRDYIFNVVKKHFKVFGFQPIETPSFENSETLMGKYGDEGDRLIFKILNSGDFLESAKKKYGNNFDIEIYELLINVHENVVNGLFKKHLSVLDLKNRFEDIVRGFTYTSRELNSLQFEYVVRLIIKRKTQIIRRCKKVLANPSYVVDDSNLKHFIQQERRNYIREVSINIAKELFELLLASSNSDLIANEVSEKALRYDLTVPFARYVVMHQNEIDFPFKRYQIQPVWRADRPQKGRFREFYQCDADVVGANSLLQEVELIQLYDAVFADLKLEGVTIKLNNRKILAGIAEVIGAQNNLVNFTVALDKLDKVGVEGVKKEMLAKGISEQAIAKAEPLFTISGSNPEQIETLRGLLSNSKQGSKGVEELEYIIDSISDLGLQTAKLSIDVTLARGLNYYTGAIFEVSAPEKVKMGSIGGGGRYDDLTGIFGLKDVSGVGISFGLDRIYLVLEELGLFPETLDKSLDVLCINFGDRESMAALKLAGELRKERIKADVYPTAAKMQKQMKYANNRKVPYVILIGDKELETNSFVVKNMNSGEQQTYSLENPQAFIGVL
jgi:histidyl-tRNA synthetase